MKMSSQLYVISGPSGVGKSTIIRKIINMVPDVGYTISHTSRLPRGDEVNGVNYHFVDRMTFKGLVDKGAFVEWAEVYNDLYGTSFSSLNEQMNQGLDILMDLDNQGAKHIKEKLNESQLIYILPPSPEALEKRIKDRGTDTDAAIKLRVTKALQEMEDCALFDYLIINDQIDRAVKKLEAILISERCRNSRMLPRISEIVTLSGGTPHSTR